MHGLMQALGYLQVPALQVCEEAALGSFVLLSWILFFCYLAVSLSRLSFWLTRYCVLRLCIVGRPSLGRPSLGVLRLGGLGLHRPFFFSDVALELVAPWEDLPMSPFDSVGHRPLETA